MSLKRWKDFNKITKNTIKIFIFIALASLPFITVTQTIGMDIFLDSFENPKYYVCLQDKDNSFGLNSKGGEYLIIQKSTHPDFNIDKSDSIIYFKNDGDIVCNKVYFISNIEAIKSYHTIDENEPIFEGQIIGKIVKIIDGNLWNSISLKIWETSINNLNLRALLTNN